MISHFLGAAPKMSSARACFVTFCDGSKEAFGAVISVRTFLGL
jgi:hypothetical protein